MVKPNLSRVRYATYASLRCFSVKPKPVLDDATSILLSNEKIKYKNHPGIIRPRTPVFPAWASKEMHNVLKEKQIVPKEINESAKKLSDYLLGRHPPLEQDAIQKKLEKVEERLNANNTDERISIEDIDFRRNRKARNILKQNVYNWQPINFDKLTCVTYLVGRGVQNYAVLRRILDEIKARDEDFEPKTLFDFGSGIGTVVWAASEIWPNTLTEYFCVEPSESMIALSERLAKAAKPEIKEIFYRQFFPASFNPTYDIVVSAYSLFELPNRKARLEAILKLWKKTERYFIVIEQGTAAGFRLVNEARDFVLAYVNSKYRRDTQSAHIFSPCPHDLSCPRYTTDNTPCNFAVLYHPLYLLGGRKHQREYYSYVVLKKDKRPEDDEQWPRIVRDALHRSGHTICRICLATGGLKEEIFTKNKHGKDMYRCARKSEWGDRLPLCYKEQENLKENESVDEKTIVK